MATRVLDGRLTTTVTVRGEAAWMAYAAGAIAGSGAGMAVSAADGMVMLTAMVMVSNAAEECPTLFAGLPPGKARELARALMRYADAAAAEG